MDELEKLLQQVAEKGLFVRIWSQRHVRILPHLPETKVEWWCELQHANGHRDSDHGGTAYTSMLNAFERAQGKRGPDNRPHDNTVPSREQVVIKDWPYTVRKVPEGAKIEDLRVKKPAPDLSFLD